MAKEETNQAVSLYSYEVIETPPVTSGEETETAASTNYHCSWCGDPPDENGSHGVCPTHFEQMIAQAAALRRSRGRS